MYPTDNTTSTSTSTSSLATPSCQAFGETSHVLLQAANFCFAAALLVPAVKRPAAHFCVRILFTAGFLSAGTWAALQSCTGPDLLAWNATLLVANCAQAVYLAYSNIPPRIRPELQELYMKLFAPLKVGKDHFRQLVRHAYVEPLDPGERYATEGVTENDQRLAVLLSGKMKVTCEDILLHYLLSNEFVDSPEWEACSYNTYKLFQVTLTATEPCQLLCWGRKELLTILESNQFLNIVLYNLIGKDITHKLYMLNEQQRKDPVQERMSIADSLEFWRNPMSRSHSVDMVHTGKKGHVHSLTWIKPENKNRRISMGGAIDRIGHSRTSNYSDPGHISTKRKEKIDQDNSQYETPV